MHLNSMSFKIFIVSIKAFYVRSAGADLKGGCRGWGGGGGGLLVLK